MNDLSEQATMPPPTTIPYGFCHCGCGTQTSIAPKNNYRNGSVKGQPRRFIHGHNAYKPRGESRTVSIDGVEYRTIPLTKGQESIVDLEDFERLSAYMWYAQKNETQTGFYALRTETVGGVTRKISMHRQILGNDNYPEIDHRNGNGLHNWKSNLRRATHVQNCMNVGAKKTNTSGFYGVSRHGNKWRGEIRFQGLRINVGSFAQASIAGAAVAQKARELRGEFART